MVQDQQTNTAVYCIITTAVFQFHRVSHADDTKNFSAIQATNHQLTTGSIGTVSRQLPVTVAFIAPGILNVIRVPRDTDSVGDIIQNRCNRTQNIAHIRFNFSTAGFEHWAILTIDNLNTQPFFHHIDDQMRTQCFQAWVGFNQLVELFT